MAGADNTVFDQEYAVLAAAYERAVGTLKGQAVSEVLDDAASVPVAYS